MPLVNNSKFYKDSIRRYGVTAKGVHWNSKYSQYKRFEILTFCIKKELNKSTIIDAGCGFGEYYYYLDKNRQIPKCYIGIDCEKQMINIAQERFPSLEFCVKDVLNDTLTKADYYVCSGAMNLLEKEFFFKFITNMWNASCKGLVFNFLKEDSFNGINPKEVITFCNKLSQDVKIYKEYLDNDMTLFLKRKF